MNKKTIQSLASGILERRKDYYPAEAMQDDTCTHNGLIGNCGLECKAYLLGKCPIQDEIAPLNRAEADGRD